MHEFAGILLADTAFHASLKPYRLSDLEAYVSYDSLVRSRFLRYRRSPGKLHKKLREGYILQASEEYSTLNFSPVFEFGAGYDAAAGRTTYINTRGLWMNGSLGKYVAFSSIVLESQGIFPEYIDSFIKQYGVVPGQGSARSFKSSGYDFSQATGYVTYQPSRHIGFRFGHDKIFIGDGYRSLLLSDNAYSYPFLQVTTDLWKLRYVNLFAQFLDLDAPHSLQSGYRKKYGSFHYLSWLAGKKVQVGFFEGVIWQGEDSTGRRGFDLNYLNPVIFYHPVNYALGSPDNVLMGLNLRVQAVKHVSLYGQVLLDDFNFAKTKEGGGFYQDKYGIQAGLKINRLFTLKSLMALAEWNHVRPFTYAHKSPYQNYAHYGQALAHPLGANFSEGLCRVRYGTGNIWVEADMVYAIYGDDPDSSSHYGRNIFKSDYAIPGFPESFGHYVGQGVRTCLLHAGIRAGWLINPQINLNFEGYIRYRKLASANSTGETVLAGIVLRTDLFNRYHDF